MYPKVSILVRATLLAAVMLGMACGDERDAPGTALAVDSAGIRIVSLSMSAWEGVRPVQLAPEPHLRIGVLDGSDDQVLYRVLGGAVLLDGGTAVLNGGSREVRFYGPDGDLRGRQGRTGEGPGEYRQPTGLWTLPGDTLVVWDERLLRITLVSPEGNLLREAPVRGRFRATQVRGVFSDGSLVLFQQRAAEEQTSTDQQIMGYYTRLSPAGEPVNTLGEFPWMRLITPPPTEVSGGMQLVASSPPVFDMETQVAAAGEGLWVGTTKRDEILWLDTSGQVRLIIRWEAPDRTVTQEVKDAAWAEIQARRGEGASAGAAGGPPRGVIFADYLPSHGELVARADGGLWMKEYPRPGTGNPNRWRIFGPGGLPEALIELPPSARVLWAGVAQVLLLERDELDVEYVRLYGLVPGAETP
jgi:hypothetical protein